jgi:hypothetical protein
MFLPKGVDSCFGGNLCASNFFCAYHSGVFTARGVVLYANQPFGSRRGCFADASPNGNEADDTINLVSHEHNEAITDPLGSAWYTRGGLENGDKCRPFYGDRIGPDYNQIINTHHYELQMEWSNRNHGCRQRYP